MGGAWSGKEVEREGVWGDMTSVEWLHNTVISEDCSHNSITLVPMPPTSNREIKISTYEGVSCSCLVLNGIVQQ